jgi:ubiquinone/menaquinone biosynthesis C-methylase UbiE
MASKLVLEPFFKSGAYAASLKRGEMITSVFARLLVEQSKLVPESKIHPDKPLVVLDNACGTGIVSSILNEKLDSTIKQGWTLTCGDISPAVLEYTQRRSEDEGWQNAETKIVDAQNPELPSAFYTHVFTAFGELQPAQSALVKPGHY